MAQELNDRQRQLLELLLSHREGLTVEGLARAVDISRAATQRYITDLETKGYLACGQLTKTAGRPVQAYVLTDKGLGFFPKQYSWFSELLLTEIKQLLGADKLKEVLARLAGEVSLPLQHRVVVKDGDERLAELTRILQELGYRADMQQESKTITACNCVFHDLAQQHHEVCTFDVKLISVLSGRDVALTECMARGGHVCRFEFGQVRPDKTD